MMGAAMVAGLETGLDLLTQGQDLLGWGDRADAHGRLNDIVPLCRRAMKYYAKLMSNDLQGARFDHDGPACWPAPSRSPSRVASCQIGLGQDQYAFDRSKQELDLLRLAARRVFHDLVARDPTS